MEDRKPRRIQRRAKASATIRVALFFIPLNKKTYHIGMVEFAGIWKLLKPDKKRITLHHSRKGSSCPEAVETIKIQDYEFNRNY